MLKKTDARYSTWSHAKCEAEGISRNSGPEGRQEQTVQRPSLGHLGLVYSMDSLSITETGIETQWGKNTMDCKNQTRPA